MFLGYAMIDISSPLKYIWACSLAILLKHTTNYYCIITVIPLKMVKC